MPARLLFLLLYALILIGGSIIYQFQSFLFKLNLYIDLSVIQNTTLFVLNRDLLYLVGRLSLLGFCSFRTTNDILAKQIAFSGFLYDRNIVHLRCLISEFWVAEWKVNAIMLTYDESDSATKMKEKLKMNLAEIL